jgi:hypothetical protein
VLAAELDGLAGRTGRRQRVQVADATPAPASDTVAQLNAAIEKTRDKQPEPATAPEVQSEILEPEDYLEAAGND